MGGILAHRGAPPEAIQKRSEEWRPAAVGSQPLVSGGIKRVYARRNALGGPARQALRPGCEELAARIRRKCRRRKRGPRPKIATAERGEARVPIARDEGHPAGCPARYVTAGLPGAAAPGRLSALRHPLIGRGE